MSSNFECLLPEFRDLAEPAVRAERLVMADPRAACFYARFPRRGIRYDQLSDEEKAHWESLDWGDQGGDQGPPDGVNASAVNKWLFNADTVDKVIEGIFSRLETLRPDYAAG